MINRGSCLQRASTSGPPFHACAGLGAEEPSSPPATLFSSNEPRTGPAPASACSSRWPMLDVPQVSHRSTISASPVLSKPSMLSLPIR